MRCCDARDLLPLLLDGQLAADERAAATARALACSQCRAELTAMAENDQALRRALAAHAVPAGYHEGFWSRLETKLDATRLEGDSMRTSASQDRTVVARESPPVDPGQDVVGKPIAKEEVSGLHEIKELAAATVRRHSGSTRAQSSQENTGEQLAIAPPALSSVATPQPGLESREPVAVRGSSVSDADGVRVAAQLAVPAAPVADAGTAPIAAAPKSSKSGLIVGVVGLLAAAAAIGLYVSKGAEQAPQAVAVAPEAVPSAPAPAVEKTPEPAVAPVKEAPVPAVAPVEAEPPAAVVEEKPKAQVGKDEPKADKEPAAVKKPADKAPKAEDKPVVATPAAEPPKERNEIDDLFGDKPAEDQAKKAAAGPALPEKLSPDDVKKGMGSVKARVQACYDQHKITGTIKLKVKIDASGAVSNVEVVDDKFKGTPTGECVTSAVKTAKFPEVSGAGLAVSYAFILQ